MQKIVIFSGDENTAKICVGFLRLSGFEGCFVCDIDDDSVNEALLDAAVCIVDEDRGFVLQKTEEKNVPVIMICQTKKEYPYPTLEKPFSMALLLENIHAILNAKKEPMISEVKSGIDIDESRRTVKLGGEDMSVTAKEFEILICLMQNPDTVFSREQLITSVWGEDFDGEIRTVDSHMARLRTKLKDWGEEHIKTVYGKGYIFSN